METFNNSRTLISIVLWGALIAFLTWYSWNLAPLQQQEIDQYMAKISTQDNTFKNIKDQEAFRAFLQEDDGWPFYTINFYKYHEIARYPEHNNTSSTGKEAFEQFSNTMVPLLLARASHPIFGTNWLTGNAREWDRLVIVRYRSRKDIAEIFATPEFAAASMHKWAALQKNERHVAQALHIPALYFPVTILLIVVGWVMCKVIRRLFSKQSQPTKPLP
tara:strand:- start:756 stop:1409 length:654 start_codon:yes stop_codon:yes gene_type:complete